ncbi:MAG: colanic acid/amylovoran biosynthesis glycosyltransferase [Acidobacteriota bacterium]|jgi:glycosyltransferase involved in cell wall biosynthesis|nr:colanic acid/amylovoran biosynthesis glycosyltransferase [Acidobacteriota bacterium]
MRVCVVRNGPLNYSETFIRQHVTELPAETVLLDDWPPWANSGSAWERTLPGRALYRALRLLSPKAYRRRIDSAYAGHFRRLRTNVVLAEFGPTGVAVTGACRRLGLPLVVHFHGYDASVRRVLEQYAAGYAVMFRQAAALVSVSRAMQRRLVEMGAPPERVHYNPCGVDCEQFGGAEPARSPPLVVAVARFVEVKAPQLTLNAFEEALRQCPEARLRMIGDGPLLEECRRLSTNLSIDHAVTFLGRQPHHVVAEEMRRARLFAQHSIEAASGAVEGTPVAVLEAGATGLPVVATRHGGIPDVVTDEETGLLVEEHDVAGMARQMLRLLRDPAAAAALGEAGQRRVRENFSSARSVGRLWEIIKGCCDGAQE